MKFSPFAIFCSEKSLRNNHVFRSSRTDSLGENGPLPRFYPRTGYRITNSSTFFFMVACSDFKVEYSLAQEPLPCVVVTLGRNEQGEFPNSEGFSRHNLVSLILGVLILAHQFRERRGSVEGLSLRGTVAFKGAAERCCKRRLNCTPFACCGGNNLCCQNW